MIGMLDSGVGGLSVLREVHDRIPGAPITYIADQAMAPYGGRPLEWVRDRVTHLTALLRDGPAVPASAARVVVIASNTGSTAALDHVRATWPDMPVVGMEPAVKPAAARSRSKVIAVMATAGTLAGDRYASVVDRFGRDVDIITVSATPLVEIVEEGRIGTAATRALLAEMLAPVRAADADVVVLACTHFPFLMDDVASVLGPGVELVDPAPAVARQVARRLDEMQWRPPITDQKAPVVALTTGDPRRLADLTQRLGVPVDVVEQLDDGPIP